MPERKPEEAHQLFAEKMNAGDLESLCALYEPDARMVARPGHVVTGSAAIREALQHSLSLQPMITLETTSVIQAGDLALMRSKWRFTGSRANGQPIDISGEGAEILRRQPDGQWLYLIDNPFSDG